MDIVGDRKFVEISGTKVHELPPLMVQSRCPLHRASMVFQKAGELVETEDLVPKNFTLDPTMEELHSAQKMFMTAQLVEEYKTIVHSWRWGDRILQWIISCEEQFKLNQELQNCLNTSLWPHASRVSFIRLLEDKAVKTESVSLSEAVGLRIMFRKSPPISCLSDQFLLYLKSSATKTAYQTWAGMKSEFVADLPPERFTFQVIDLSSS